MHEEHRVALLNLDPELGRLLAPERAHEAAARLTVRVHALTPGVWRGDRLVPQPEVGLLVVEGMLAREVLMADTVSTELLGAGDLLRPWQVDEPSRLLATQVRWSVLSDLRLAVLDRVFAAQLGHFPEINAVLFERLTERVQRLATTQAISQLNGVDRRLLALLWHLAERWGHVTPAGVVVPMTLSHRMLAQLVGARRPTVSTALRDLTERGDVVRREDGTWLLAGQPVGVPSGAVERFVVPRRRFLPSEQDVAS